MRFTFVLCAGEGRQIGARIDWAIGRCLHRQRGEDGHTRFSQVHVKPSLRQSTPSQATVFSATVFPPVLGPLIINCFRPRLANATSEGRCLARSITEFEATSNGVPCLAPVAKSGIFAIGGLASVNRRFETTHFRFPSKEAPHTRNFAPPKPLQDSGGPERLKFSSSPNGLRHRTEDAMKSLCCLSPAIERKLIVCSIVSSVSTNSRLSRTNSPHDITPDTSAIPAFYKATKAGSPRTVTTHPGSEAETLNSATVWRRYAANDSFLSQETEICRLLAQRRIRMQTQVKSVGRVFAHPGSIGAKRNKNPKQFIEKRSVRIRSRKATRTAANPANRESGRFSQQTTPVRRCAATLDDATDLPNAPPARGLGTGTCQQRTRYSKRTVKGPNDPPPRQTPTPKKPGESSWLKLIHSR